MRRALGVCLWIAACGGHTKEKAGPHVTVTPAELDALASDLNAKLDASRAATCPRPPLRGAALPGPATDDLLALTEPSAGSPVALCAAAVNHRVAALAPLVDATGELAPELRSIAAACQDVPAALAKAVGHEDTCSPYLPGRRAIPDPGALTSVTLAARILARQLANDGKVADGMRLLFDARRFAQDLQRGGTAGIMTNVSFSEERIVDQTIQSILASGAPLTDAELASLEAEARALEASEPPLAGYFLGQKLDFGLTDRLPRLHSGVAMDAIEWIATNEELDEDLAACPPGASVHACFVGLGALAEKREAPKGKPASSGDEKRGLIDNLKKFGGTAAGPIAELLRKHEERAQALAGLRLDLAIRRLALSPKACPAADDAALAPLLQPASLGDALELSPAGDGFDVDVAGTPVWHARCR